MESFELSYKRHLVAEQRRAVLEALAERFEPGVTMGEVIDAAQQLGWSEPMGELTLADLARALLESSDAPEAGSGDPVPAGVDGSAEHGAKSRVFDPKIGRAVSAASTATTGDEPAPVPTRIKTSRLKALRAKIDAEERMSLEEAAELLVPIVGELGQATMQDLEDFTGIGRRKLRFHIGQLVRHEYLLRHGMGRGTHYTTKE